MTKYYTFGEMVDTMEFGQVAIKVEGNKYKDGTTLKEDDNLKLVVSKVGATLFFDENDCGMLKSICGREIFYCKDFEEEKERYVIISREAYDSINNIL